MKDTSVLQAFAYIDDRYVLQADERVKSKPILLRITAVAACLCLLVGGGLLAHFGIDADAHEVLTRSPSDIPFLSANYPTPGCGEVQMYLDLSATVENDRYKDALFQVEIWLNDISGPVFRQPCCRQEAKRLADCGLEVYTQDVEWTGYWGETVRRTNIVALLTKDQLKHFPADERYGYMLSFTGDNVNLAEYTLVE